MNFLILVSWWALSAAQTAPPPAAEFFPSFRILSRQPEGEIIRFNLDFGCFEIHEIQASLKPEFFSVRLPASVSRSGRSYPALDFLTPEMEKRVLESLSNSGPSPSRIPCDPGAWNLHAASLEQDASRQGTRLARAEIWLGGVLTLRVTLMKSKWNEDRRHWWVAYPARWDKRENRFRNLFEIKDKAFKKKIAGWLSELYRERYSLEEDY